VGSGGTCTDRGVGEVWRGRGNEQGGNGDGRAVEWREGADQLLEKGIEWAIAQQRENRKA
ncbi:hypothetical protein, partial [Salmonella enterica]|uniref:hypothetical protein n=1 Tax=Salmonella enterica TaxID=28901 RepID=UPI00398C2717